MKSMKSMKSVKSMKGGKCDNCSCGKRGGAYGKGMSYVGAPLTKMGGARKSKRGGSKKSRRTKRKTRSNRVKRGGSLKCPGWKLSLEDQIMGKSVVSRYETCKDTN